MSPATAPAYGLERVFRQRCREWKPRLNPGDTLSGRDVAKNSGRPKQLRYREESNAWRENSGGLQGTHSGARLSSDQCTHVKKLPEGGEAIQKD